jgi:hypothetical protein
MQPRTPVIWSRQLIAAPAVAGHNAIAAARLLAQRQAELRAEQRRAEPGVGQPLSAR